MEDPQTHKRIPTVNRTQYTSIYDDENYKSALQYADFSQKILYEEEAKVINDIQKSILDISSKEEPFDVFICYKETDESGRTRLFVLPAPDRAESQSPSDNKVPYANYNMLVEAEGYVSNIHLNIPVFSGVTSLQRSNMLLLETAGEDKSPQIFDEAEKYDL